MGECHSRIDFPRRARLSSAVPAPESSTVANEPDSLKLNWLTWTLAFILAGLALWLRFRFVQSAGGLWRDEMGTVALAQLPTLRDMAGQLEFESFPFVWPLILRALTALDAGSDVALRIVGLSVSVASVTLLLWVARAFHRRPPLIALVLLGFNLTIIHWGTTVRGHGMGIFTALLAVGTFGRLLLTPTRQWIVLATLAATLAVHTSYYNAVVVFALGAGFLAAALADPARRPALWGAGIAGATSALSLVPLIGVFRRGAEWKSLVEIEHFDLARFASQMHRVLVGTRGVELWVGLALIGLAWSLWSLRRASAATAAERSVAIFAVTVLIVEVLGHFLFLRALRYPTEMWYYLQVLAVSAVCIDALIGARPSGPRQQIFVAILSLAGATAVLPYARAAAPKQLTNVDIAARAIQNEAHPGDLVVVSPFFYGLTYARYHTGPAEWTSIPPFGHLGVHRYDLLKTEMSRPDPADTLAPIQSRIATTLGQGHRVFFLGQWLTPEASTVAAPKPQIIAGDYRGHVGEFFDYWNSETVQFITAHSAKVTPLVLKTRFPVSEYERVELVVAEGTR